jgi:hypothetical protein
MVGIGEKDLVFIHWGAILHDIENIDSPAGGLGNPYDVYMAHSEELA